MNLMVNGSLPPRRKKRKRRKFPVYYGFAALAVFLFAGVLVAQAADVFGEKNESSQETGAAEVSGDFDEYSDSYSDEVLYIDDDGDPETEQGEKRENPDEKDKNPLKETAKDTPGKKTDSNEPRRGKSGGEKSHVTSPGKKGEKPATVVATAKIPSQLSDSGAVTASNALSAFEKKVVELVNQERINRGLAPLEADVQLSRVARVKSEDMRDNGYFSHDSPTYGSVSDMLRKFGIQFRAAGENIAAGYPTPEAVVDGWMNSSGHRENILNPEFTHIGVGYAEGGQYQHTWTQQFISK